MHSAKAAKSLAVAPLHYRDGRNLRAVFVPPRAASRDGGRSMSYNDDSCIDIEVEVLDPEAVREYIDNALVLAGHSWEELQEQAQAGKFTTETAREAWFAVSTFAEPTLR